MDIANPKMKNMTARGGEELTVKSLFSRALFLKRQ
jgi:hypothetical protein